MIQDDEEKWLAEKLPSLTVNEDKTEIRGTLEFSAVYDKTKDEFTWLLEPDQVAAGEILTGTYKILIKKRGPQEIPSLLIEDEGIPRTLDRHFYTKGGSCLCGPTEEVDFMPRYSFIEYLDRYVIQFLYAQRFYDLHGRWPWRAYSHNATGILESYRGSQKRASHLHACLKRLPMCAHWERVRAFLWEGCLNVESRKCFCGSGKNIKRCHVDAWLGLIELRRDIKIRGISIPTLSR